MDFLERQSSAAKPVILLAMLSTGVLLAGCGGGSVTRTLGTSQVTVSEETDSVIDAMRQIAEQEPYVDGLRLIMKAAEVPASERRVRSGRRR